MRETVPVASAAVHLPGATQVLAKFVAGLHHNGVPGGVRRVLQSAIVDAVGCGLYGLTTPAGRIIQEFAVEQGGPGESTLWASGGKRVSNANAALAIGTAIHCFDFDDYHRAKIHPSAAVLPAVLALGESQSIDGATCLASLAAGYEVMIRVSLAANPSASRMRGWHLTGTCGTFGAAAAASVILRLDASTTASALGLAGTQSAGLWAFNADGAMSKRFHPGRSAQSGIIAALLAKKGFQGPREILEAADGGFLEATSDDVRLPEIERDLGHTWHTEGVCFKPYACCGSNHACVSAALELMTDHGFRADQIRKVIVGVSHVVERQTGFPYRPSTVVNAQMSIRYDIAVALIDRHVQIDQFTEARIADPTVCDLASRIEVEVDPEVDALYPGRFMGTVTIVLDGGRQFRKRVDYSKGTPENMMTADELSAKFRSLAGAAVGGGFVDGILEELANIFDVSSISGIARDLGALHLKQV